MCGIVGVFGDLMGAQERIFQDMLRVDVVRGEDGCGMIGVDWHGKAHGAKNLALPSDFLWTAPVKKMFNRKNIALIGHNRAATQGAVTPDNAHPFRFKHIIGVHNGTLIDKSRLLNGASFDIDSKAIINHIAEKGIDDCWKHLDGAATLVWWDAKEQSLNFIRNSQRPLHFRWSQSHHVLYFASEPWMLCDQFLQRGSRAHIKLEDETWHPNPHYLHTFKLAKLTVEKEVRKLDPFVYAPGTGRSLPSYSGNGGAHVWTPYGWVPLEDYERAGGDEAFKEMMRSFETQQQAELDLEGEQSNTSTTRKSGSSTKRGGKKPQPRSGGTSTKGGNPLAKKEMSRRQFKKNFRQCCVCSESLAGEYDTAVIVSKYAAMCGDCATFADDENIKVVGGM